MNQVFKIEKRQYLQTFFPFFKKTPPIFQLLGFLVLLAMPHMHIRDNMNTVSFKGTRVPGNELKLRNDTKQKTLLS